MPLTVAAASVLLACLIRDLHLGVDSSTFRNHASMVNVAEPHKDRLSLQAQQSGQVDYDSDDSSWSPAEVQDWENESSQGSEDSKEETQNDRSAAEASTSGREDLMLPAADANLLQRADAGLLSEDDKRRLSDAAGLSLYDAPQPRPQMPIMW